MKVPCHYYPSECQKILELLNQKKAEGYIITRLDLKNGTGIAYFEETDQQFIYSLDYSIKYVKDKFCFQEQDEYFDIAKLNGWKLQCYSENIGVWTNTDLKATPFYLDEEYEEIKEQDYQSLLRHFYKQLIGNAFILILAIMLYFRNRSLDIFYGLPSFLFFIYIAFQTLKRKKTYPGFLFEYVNSSYVWTMLFLGEGPILFVVMIQILLVLSYLDLLRENSFILKRVCHIRGLSRLFWVIIVVYVYLYII